MPKTHAINAILRLYSYICCFARPWASQNKPATHEAQSKRRTNKVIKVQSICDVTIHKNLVPACRDLAIHNLVDVCDARYSIHRREMHTTKLKRNNKTSNVDIGKSPMLQICR